MEDKWVATAHVIGDSRQKVIEGLNAAIRQLSVDQQLGAFSGDEGYTYVIDLKKPESLGS